MARSSSDYYARLSADCRHTDRTVCYECVYHHMITILGNNISAPIICPERECRTRFSTDDVRQILMYYDNNTLLDKYDIYLTNLLLDDMPEFIWCAYGCGSGQFHLSYSSKVVCIYCHRATCFFHRIPWHEKITCEEYDALGLSNDPMSTKYLELFSKQCPKCKVRIEKIDGCDHMTCTRCEAEFCWECLAVFGPADSLNTCQHQNSCINFQRRIIYPFVPRRRRRLARLLHRCPIS